MPPIYKDHASLLQQAMRIFPGARIVRNDTYERARDRTFAFLREQYKHPEPVERWKLACNVMWAVCIDPDIGEPWTSWALQVIEVDLADMLKKLHAAGKGLEYESSICGMWPNKNDEDEPTPF